MVLERENKQQNEDLARLYDESINDIKEGQILKGKIVQIGEKEILVDVGYKSEGVVHKSEFSDIKELKVGDVIDVMLESKENDMGMVVLSHEKAKRYKGWQNIMENCKEGDSIEGKVFKKVRGGFMVDVGMDAFLPASLSMMQDFGNADNILGQKLEFKIVKINIPRKNIVLSRREIVEEQRRGEKRIILEGLTKGDLVKGVVRNITDFGAFVDIGGGITGLLHITDMSWGRINHPNEVVKVGDEIEVKVLDFDKVSVKVSLGLKQKTTNPWEKMDEKYPENEVIKGKVVNIMPYGIFIELEKGIEGLIHISEFSWSKKFNHPSEEFQVGDEVEAMILKVDKDNQKLSLGIKQLETDPWEGVEERYNVGDQIKGKISAVTDYGAFVELEQGVEGLVHVSDLSWTKRVTHPKDILKKDEEIEAIILNVDEQNRRIALGVKQLAQDPWDEISKKYSPDTFCKGKITNITNFGIFVELEEDLEGLLHISEINLGPQQRMEDLYKVGDAIDVKIIHIDGVQKKIALSQKGVEGEAPAPEQEKKEEEPKAEAETGESEKPAEEEPKAEAETGVSEKPAEEEPKAEAETGESEKPAEEEPRAEEGGEAPSEESK
ncbi:30S ribosomal protein S1 [Candidatus Omnitrophota bacterium]